MKTSSVLASVLFSTMALAAPLNKRAYATKTEVEVEYYTVYTTVTGARPAAAATSEAAQSYEVVPTTADVAQPTTTSISSVAQAPTSQAPPPVVPTTSAQPTPSAPSSPPPPPAETATPTPPPPAYTPPPPPSSTAAAPEPQATQASTGGGQTYTGGSLTYHPFGGALGACGKPIQNTDAAVALDATVFGDATVDYMTGLTTNEWCGKWIEITNNGKTVKAQVMDRCPGCTGGGLDTTRSIWDTLTGGLGGDAGDRQFTSSWKVVSA